MLSYLKWQQPEVKADPFALSTLIAWLKEQPPDKYYSWRLASECPLAQYFKAMGFADFAQTSAVFGNRSTLFGRVVGIGGDSYIDTFGEALQRARACALAAQERS